MASAALSSADREGIEREVLHLVAGLVAELGGLRSSRDVTLDDSLDRDLPIGSLERVELLLLRLEQAFGGRLPDAVMAEAVTPRDLVTAILTAEPPRAEVQAVVRAPVSAGAAAPARPRRSPMSWPGTRTPPRTGSTSSCAPRTTWWSCWPRCRPMSASSPSVNCSEPRSSAA
jgi:acyl carrier protein